MARHGQRPRALRKLGRRHECWQWREGRPTDRRAYTGFRMSESVSRDVEPDPVVEAYKAGVDRTLIRERLARTPAERLEDLVALARFAEELRRAGAAARRAP
jgi:hypothetical protein